MEASEIGPAIRAARVAAGMRQVDVAERIGSNNVRICCYERGSEIPSAAVLCSLAEVFPTLPLEELLEAQHRHRVELKQNCPWSEKTAVADGVPKARGNSLGGARSGYGL